MTLTEFFAGYSAIVATAVATWNVITYLRDGARLRVTAHPNMKLMGSGVVDNNMYITVNVANVGNRATTIQTLGMYTFKSRWHRWRRKHENLAWVINCSPPGNTCPHVLDPGHKFMGLALQSEDVEKRTRDKLTYIAIGHSMGKQEVLVRVQPITPTAKD